MVVRVSPAILTSSSGATNSGDAAAARKRPKAVMLKMTPVTTHRSMTLTICKANKSTSNTSSNATSNFPSSEVIGNLTSAARVTTNNNNHNISKNKRSKHTTRLAYDNNNSYYSSDDDSSTTPVQKKSDSYKKQKQQSRPLSSTPEKPIPLKACFLLTLSQIISQQDDDESTFINRITSLQTHVRGTLARWNLPLLKLEHQKQAVEALKQKQLKKLQQRTKQQMLAFRVQMEHEHEHRVQMRHLKRASVLKELFTGQTTRAEQEGAELYKDTQTLTQQNQDLQESLEELECKTRELERVVKSLEATQQDLQVQCQDYKLAVDIWNQQMADTSS